MCQAQEERGREFLSADDVLSEGVAQPAIPPETVAVGTMGLRLLVAPLQQLEELAAKYRRLGQGEPGVAQAFQEAVEGRNPFGRLHRPPGSFRSIACTRGSWTLVRTLRFAKAARPSFGGHAGSFDHRHGLACEAGTGRPQGEIPSRPPGIVVGDVDAPEQRPDGLADEPGHAAARPL